MLRQIENLQASLNEQKSTYELVERNLQDRLNEAQIQSTNSQEKERVAHEKVMQLNSKVVSLESQLNSLRSEKSLMISDYEIIKAKLTVAEDGKAE